MDIDEILYNEKKGYTKALVLFIDILGSQSRNNFDELYEINKLFHSELLENVKQDREYIAYQRHIYTFSDCAYLIYDYKDKFKTDWGKLFNIALLNCEPLLMKFLSKELIFRGGVAFGNVYYDKNMFFGDAINKAYQYENKVSKFPRIVVDKYVVKQIFPLYKGKKERIIQKDSDGEYYLNYFKSIQEGIDYSPIVQKTNKQFINDLIEFCNSKILTFSSNNNIRSKYEWLKEYSSNSQNNNIIDKIIYKKPLLDQIVNNFFKNSNLNDSTPKEFIEKINLLPNTGASVDFLKYTGQLKSLIKK